MKDSASLVEPAPRRGGSSESLGRIEAFRSRHPARSIGSGARPWRYIVSGHGADAILVLPGALGTSSSVSGLIEAFATDFRVVSPDYGSARSIAEICDTLSTILEIEGIERIHVIGGSYGGVLAQCFARVHPELVRGLVLSHTFVVLPGHAWRFRLARRLWKVLPTALIRSLLRRRLDSVMLGPLRDAGSVDVALWSAYLDEAVVTSLSSDALLEQQDCLLDCAVNYQLHERPAPELMRRTLILESDNDPVIKEADRERLRATWPVAEVHTFHGTYHVSSLLATDSYVEVVKTFFRKLSAIS